MNLFDTYTPERVAKQEEMPSWIYMNHKLQYYSFNAVEMITVPFPSVHRRKTSLYDILGFTQRFYNSIAVATQTIYGYEDIINIERITQN